MSNQSDGIRFCRKRAGATPKVAATNIFSSRRRSFPSRWCTMLKGVARESLPGLLGNIGPGPWERNLVWHTEVRASTKKNTSRWKHITPGAEGVADRFACELLHEKFWRALDKGLRKVRTSGASGTLAVTCYSCGRMMSGGSVLIATL